MTYFTTIWNYDAAIANIIRGGVYDASERPYAEIILSIKNKNDALLHTKNKWGIVRYYCEAVLKDIKIG